MIVDDEVAFVGGIDLTLARRRPLRHERASGARPARLARRGSRLRGPAVADVAAHFAARWSEVTGERRRAARRAAAGAGDVEVQVVRTLPERHYDFLPRGDFRILEAYVRALRSAERLVYLESQFLWAPEVVDVLAAQAPRPADTTTSASSSCCPRARTTARTTRAASSAVLADADRGAHRFLAATICARTGRTIDRSTSTRRSGSSTTAG